jgi:hypothetical protein
VTAGFRSVKVKSANGLVVVDDDDDDDDDDNNAENVKDVGNGIISASDKVKVKSVIKEDADSDDNHEVGDGIFSNAVGHEKLTEQTIDRRSSKFPAVFKSVRKVTSRVDNYSDESSEDEDEDEDVFSEEECEENNDVDHLLDELLNHFSVEEIWENAEAQQWPTAAVDLTNDVELDSTAAVDLTNDEELDCADKKVLHQLSTFSPQPNKTSPGESHFLSSEINLVTPDSKQA